MIAVVWNGDTVELTRAALVTVGSQALGKPEESEACVRISTDKLSGGYVRRRGVSPDFLLQSVPAVSGPVLVWRTMAEFGLDSVFP